MTYPLITYEQLASRLGIKTLERAFDDSGAGVADDDPLNQILLDASSKVLGKIKGMYNVDAIKALAAEDMPHELVRVALDQAVAMTAQRCPEVVRVEWLPLMQQADKDLKELRLNEKGLDTQGAPEPPANVGGGIVGASSDGEPIRSTFLGGNFCGW